MSNKINFRHVSEIFFLLAVIFLFFPIRHIFLTSQAFQTGAYSDFTSISLYISDIFLILSFLFILPRGIKIIFSKKTLILAVFWLIIVTLAHWNNITPLNWYFFIKYLEFVIVAYGTAQILLEQPNFRFKFLYLFVFLNTLESILGTFQFIFQKSIGLRLLGEQVIAPNMTGVAKIIVKGQEYIRAYGTFPHPNLFSAFVFVSFFANVYLLSRAKSNLLRLFLMVSLLINIFGLTLSFSRAAYLAAFFGIILYFVILAKNHLINKRSSAIILLIFGGFLLAGVILKPFIFTRATVTDDASLERIFYLKVGFAILKRHPFFGDGLGQSVLDMQKYSPIKLQSWQIQSVHNYFILAATEMGVVGAALLVLIFLLHAKQLVWQISKTDGVDKQYSIVLLAILVGIILLMQFDHYFYTIEQTQILLWMFLGSMASKSNFNHL